jgi:hypothetical protein
VKAALVPSLYTVATILALSGIALWFVPLPVAKLALSQTAMLATPRAPDPSAQAAALLEYEQIVQSNVFAQDRSPPQRRYTPPGSEPAVTPPARQAAPRIRLYGVASGPSGAVALIDADRAIPGAEIYRPGDRVGGYLLETVADTFVVLSSPEGSRTIRLELPQGRSP